jgi:hypothetical protein
MSKIPDFDLPLKLEAIKKNKNSLLRKVSNFEDVFVSLFLILRHCRSNL